MTAEIVTLPVIRIERNGSELDDDEPPKVICSACSGKGSEPHEEGPRGATWTVYEKCTACKGRGYFIWRR